MAGGRRLGGGCLWGGGAIFKRYPEIGDRPEKVLSNPPESSIPSKGSIEPPFGPKKVLQNPCERDSRTTDIEPFASNPPFLGYPFKTLPNLGELL